MSCRSCHATTLSPIVSLGAMPLANSYLLPAQLKDVEPRFPLDLVRCTACQLVQITHVVPPEILFRDYLYLSSYSPTMLRSAEELVTRLVRDRKLGSSSLAVEVASNDGYLLQYYVRAGVPVLGIEPARNVAQLAEERGVRTLPEFFGVELAERLRAQGTRADVIHANNVLAHVADLNGFVAGFATLLADDGVLVSESPYLRPFLEHVEFDTIYHEHLYYYSLTALSALLARHELVIEDCEPIALHGGSLRIFARHAQVATPTARVRALLDEERAWGVATDAPYRRFAGSVDSITGDLARLVRRLRAEGKRVAAYGAAAKGTVMLNACRLGTDDLEFVCDKNPLKQGRVMPGVHVPIVAPGELVARRPDYCVLLAWNFADEIRREQAGFEAAGGRFIVPIPTVRVLS
jgi:SAM-dependent methyltransferase